MKKLFIGSLPFSVKDEQLKELFSQAGKVESATVIKDKMSGRSKGFAFVEFSNEAEAEKAIEMFNNLDLEGRKIFVAVARPSENRSRSDFTARNRNSFKHSKHKFDN